MPKTVSTLLVSGASGHLGRAALATLLAAGANNIIATTRHPASLATLTERGVRVRHADFDAPETLSAAFAGANRMLLVSTDQLAIPGQRRAQHANAIAAARQAGVDHLCYTSMPHPELALGIGFAADHVFTERLLANSNLRYTILRNSWYAEDLLFLLPQVLRSGVWYTTAGSGGIAYVARADTARAAAAALKDGSGRAIVDICGAELHTVAEIAAIASTVFDRRIEVVQVSDAELPGKLAAQGVPDFYVPLAAMTDRNQRDGHFEVGGDAIRRLTGTPPQTLMDFFKQHHAAFVGEPARSI